VIFAAISDVLWQALIAAVVTLVLGWMQMRTKNAVVTSAENAAVKVETVKNVLAAVDTRTSQKLEDLADVTNATHTLVNSNMGVQLQLNATLARRVAELTKSPLDAEVADKADRMLSDHQSRQSIVDGVKAKEAT
jgi:hypothetical protein